MWEKKTSSGSIQCLGIFGDELTIVNSARVSFGVEHTELDEQDGRLLKYLIKHRHFSPFRHVMFRFRITAPEFVMRQWYKHVVGAEWTSSSVSQLHGWNEISGRYVILQDEFYHPTTWRLQSKNNKQGSDGVLPLGDQTECDALLRDCYSNITTAYKALLDKGVAKEQARCLLPLSVMSCVMWTCSLQALIHFIDLRRDSHAQLEIREFAVELEQLLRERFPHTYDAFFPSKE